MGKRIVTKEYEIDENTVTLGPIVWDVIEAIDNKWTGINQIHVAMSGVGYAGEKANRLGVVLNLLLRYKIIKKRKWKDGNYRYQVVPKYRVIKTVENKPESEVAA